MGLSTYLKAYNYMSDAFDNKLYERVSGALEGIVPLDIGLRHNAHRNIQIEIPIATWHKGYSVDWFLWEKAGERDTDEYEIESWTPDVEDLILEARDYAENPDRASKFGSPEEDPEWISKQFLRLERALTDFVLDDRLKSWTLKVWRSY